MIRLLKMNNKKPSIRQTIATEKKMILLVDNYDSFTYNLARYIGKFDEAVLNDDATENTTDALVLFAWSRLASEGKME